ncbi:alpha/beta fold hydrolase [Conexibacter sp. JD483]|uniref:alpha/beta fold hydrolase n=1 Tax=unclassified Conexibacter TaxID=2627773 RepID=UPI00271B20CD|nr:MULTISPECIES: alpha/beta fold hydrolase [unclassified Conexibacter]MDO8184254.1 alpha/beta fold hydrolase [Conexibacter sp. CPCC 205706]MDO8197560.1 alpha/beta fold hydrolase [Conexibacter sp. CPCC 205762]MDR9373081.1 alpha/beta fold hydrolase [Conexibacter sp. JD483]
MDPIPTPEQLSAAAANVFDRVMRGGLADLRPLPSAIVDEGPQRTVRRFLRPGEPAGGAAAEASRPPVLLVPPLAAPATCFDLRRGCSVAEHLLAAGHRPYLVDYGSIHFGDRNLGIEHWIDEVIPQAIDAVRRDAGADEVQLVGWCLGGIMSLLVAAETPGRVRSIAMVASPFDTSAVPLVAPLRPLVNLAGGSVGTAAYKLLGGAPAPLVKRVYQLAGFDKYVMKPFTLATNLDDRDFLAQVEAVDRFMGGMLAYPGRTFGQIYHRLLRRNDLAQGRIVLGDRTIELSAVTAPVLSIAGEGDGIAPAKAVHRVAQLLPNAPSVKIASAPGGHLGVLTGRAARRTTWPLIDDFLDATAAADGDGRARRHLRAVA